MGAILRVNVGGTWVGIPAMTGPQGEAVELSRVPEGSGNAVTGLKIFENNLTLQKLVTFMTGAKVSGTGNAVTDVTVDGDKIKADKGLTFLTEHQDVSRLQEKAILDEGGYFRYDTVEDALQQLGGTASIIGTAVNELQNGAPVVVSEKSRTLELADTGCMLQVTLDSLDAAATITVPTNTDVPFAVGAEMEIVQWGQSPVVIAAAEGVTIRSMDGMAETAGQYASVTLKKMGDNLWLLGGALK